MKKCFIKGEVTDCGDDSKIGVPIVLKEAVNDKGFGELNRRLGGGGHIGDHGRYT